ncbi:4377_t:CDS:2 [Ambispora gerdemannii]|uniref:4377_t:CDS:1 n=1 Tax=Ambispora gerdemannii TaxID=144530 RepID=A0A9N9BCN4_9GLOM|nr:4377_t:CDS:2 [Ambispora gerdemannii]
MTITRWPNLMQEIKRVLKPGGIIEQHELDAIAHNAGPKFQNIQNYGNETSSTSEKQKQGFNYIGGRKFYDIVPYVLPADIEEDDRLHQQHFALKYICGGNYTAPIHDLIKPGSKILDLGCGPGQWTLEMAQEFPQADVYGIDINANFPTTIKPANSHFLVGNVTERLPWEDNYFDFIWIRYLFVGIMDADWQNLYHEVRRVLKPGGILEHHECDGLTVNPGPKFKKFLGHFEEAFISRDLSFRLACELSERMTMAGFEDQLEGGKIGEIWAANLKDGTFAMKPWLSKLTGLTDDEYDSVVQYIFDYEIFEYDDYHNHHMVWARKNQ